MSCIEAPEDPYPIEYLERKKHFDTMSEMNVQMSTRILQTADPTKQVFT